jgi:hypothetical protein
MKLSPPQEKCLLRWHLVRDFPKHKWTTIQALLDKGFLAIEDDCFVVTPKGVAYCDENHLAIRL